MGKPNVVLVHSFLANSTIMSGYREFLEDWFNIHFVDLPGFHPEVPPLDAASLQGFSKHLEEKIESLNLDSYWLAGMSFGFLVVNTMKGNEKCKGYIGIHPYLNRNFLKINNFKRKLQSSLLRTILFLGISEKIFYSSFFKSMLDTNPAITDTIIKTTDPHTFFETAYFLLTYNQSTKFHDKPYALIINIEDATIHGSRVIEQFSSIPQQLVIQSSLSH